MKKILILFLLLIIPTGCINMKTNINELINSVQKSKVSLVNQTRTGYRYYLPPDLNVNNVKGLNEIIFAKEYKYFMYVDLVSYYNKINKPYEVNESAYISQNISYNNINGYLEVNVKDKKYLIEIMYNYAKIELIVDKKYLNEAVTNALIILSTIKYNDDIIKNMMDGDILNFGEEQLNIFETNKEDSKYLEYLEQYDKYDGDVIPDLDIVN